MPERELIDPSDGENIAVRSFLAMYGARGLTTPEMRAQMTAAGFPHWPEWADSDPGRLTKHGAQDWLRHLFALETAALAQPVAAEVIETIIRDACECDRPEKYDVDTLELRVSDLRLILQRNISPTPA